MKITTLNNDTIDLVELLNSAEKFLLALNKKELTVKHILQTYPQHIVGLNTVYEIYSKKRLIDWTQDEKVTIPKLYKIRNNFPISIEKALSKAIDKPTNVKTKETVSDLDTHLARLEKSLPYQGSDKEIVGFNYTFDFPFVEKILRLKDNSIMLYALKSYLASQIQESLNKLGMDLLLNHTYLINEIIWIIKLSNVMIAGTIDCKIFGLRDSDILYKGKLYTDEKDLAIELINWINQK